jgi:glycosidase
VRFPNPSHWRDQIFYQLLPDRFSDGREDTRPLFDPNRPDRFTAPDKATWMTAGNRFLGGTLKGAQSKLDGQAMTRSSCVVALMM